VRNKLGKTWEPVFATVLCVAASSVARANPIYGYQAATSAGAAIHELLDSNGDETIGSNLGDGLFLLNDGHAAEAQASYGSENQAGIAWPQTLGIDDTESYTAADLSNSGFRGSSAPFVGPNARTGTSLKQGGVSDNQGSAGFNPVRPWIDTIGFHSLQDEFSFSDTSAYQGLYAHGLGGTWQVGSGLHSSTTTVLFDVAGNNGNGGHHHLGKVVKLYSDSFNPVDPPPAAVPEPGALGPALAVLAICGVVFRKRLTA